MHSVIPWLDNTRNQACWGMRFLHQICGMENNCQKSYHIGKKMICERECLDYVIVFSLPTITSSFYSVISLHLHLVGAWESGHRAFDQQPDGKNTALQFQVWFWMVKGYLVKIKKSAWIFFNYFPITLFVIFTSVKLWNIKSSVIYTYLTLPIIIRY